MKKIAEIIKTTLILFLITSISALLLAFVNEKTAPIIAKNEVEKQTQALRTIMSDAADFKEISISDEMDKLAYDKNCEVNGVYEALSDNGEVIGICSIITGSGYESGLNIAVGVNKEMQVSDIQIISSSETPGLGQNASKAEFKEQYKGKSGGLSVVKSGAKDNEINAISGATLTSNGVTEIVNLAVEIAKVNGGEANE